MLSVTEPGANSRIINEKPLGKTKMRITYIFNYLQLNEITLTILVKYITTQITQPQMT